MFFGVLLMVMMFPAPSARAEEENNGDGDKTGAPYFYVETDDTSVDSFPLKKTSVTADINGMIADIHVVQSYANEGKSRLMPAMFFRHLQR